MSVCITRNVHVLLGRGAAVIALCVNAQAQEASLDATPIAPHPAGVAAPLIIDEPAEALQQQAEARADENAVRQAEDAFGSTIGRESIGIRRMTFADSRR